MPQVGKKKFAYTKAGKKKAKAYAKKKEKRLDIHDNSQYEK